MESNPSRDTSVIGLNGAEPSYDPLITGFDWQLLAVIGAWDALPEDVKATIHFIAATSLKVHP